ncbi:MAG: carboxypeptidase regulatory-like domain-containing protein [Myxococcales bacterium]|nr:carboxypeptidase regulatory-like domain-containing protein [Myxococcales bacterium]
MRKRRLPGIRATHIAFISLPIFITACIDATDESPPEAPIVDSQSQSLATLTGRILDTQNMPVADADVMLALNGIAVGEATLTAGDGTYALPVHVPAIRDALAKRQEITLLVYSPYEDRGARGTFSGDRIHLLPVTLRQFVDLEAVEVGGEYAVRTAYVPLQAIGYQITDELVRDGGELTWRLPDSPAGDVEVSLIIAPGAIKIAGDEPQREITLTIIENEKAPMAIPDDGYGVMWTIQPRDIVFDPPAKMRIKGDRLNILGLVDSEPGNTFELFGASLDRGWRLYGDMQIVELSGNTVVLESPDGIIQRGAWGHVLSDPASDAGMLATCRNKHSGLAVVCAIFAPRGFELSGPPLSLFETQVARRQADYNPVDRPFWYTDHENRCQNCTNIGRPEAQMAVGLSVGLPEEDSTGVFVVATELCQSEVNVRPLNDRDALILNRIANWSLQFGVDEVDPGDGAGQTPRTQLWESFCNDEDACPAYDPADLEIHRRQFSRNHIFQTSNLHCAEGDRQAGR